MKKKKVPISQFFLQKISLEQKERLKIQKEGNRDKEPNLLNISNALDDYYFFEKLRVYIAYLSYSQMANKNLIGYDKQSIRLLDNILQLIGKEQQRHPAIDIYFKLVQLFTQSKKGNSVNSAPNLFNSFANLEALIIKNQKIFTTSELIELYSYLTTFSVFQINIGNTQFLTKNIVNSQNLIKLEELKNSNFIINAGAYKNIVVLILKLEGINDINTLNRLTRKVYKNVYEWANDFIEKYKLNLLKKNRDKYYRYCKALVLFKMKKYEESFNLLSTFRRVRTMFISFDIKLLQLQLLVEYELIYDCTKIDNEKQAKEIGAIKKVLENNKVPKEIENFRKMLDNDKNNRPKLEYQRVYYWEFYYLIKRFYSFFNEYGCNNRFYEQEVSYKRKIKELKGKLSNSNYSYQSWFREKLEEIK